MINEDAVIKFLFNSGRCYLFHSFETLLLPTIVKRWTVYKSTALLQSVSFLAFP